MTSVEVPTDESEENGGSSEEETTEWSRRGGSNGGVDVYGRSGGGDEKSRLGRGGRRRFSALRSVELNDGEVDDEEEDIEANQDLSLLIVDKARKRQKVEVVDVDSVDVTVSENRDVESGGERGNREFSHDNVVAEPGLATLSGVETEEGELLEDAGNDLVVTLDASERGESADGAIERKKRKKKEKKEKKERKKKKKGRGNEQKNERAEKTEVQALSAEKSIVMRKLLRERRYFDPPDEQELICSSCGKIAHLAADCPEAPRLKPCYVCGAFGHDGRECPQKTECFSCGKVGHMAKNCPQKGTRGRGRDETICLLCGRSGHEAAFCTYDYDKQDLERVQCYICKEYGHLSCVDIVDSTPVPVSCYMCGEMGHIGVECGRRVDREKGRDWDRPVSVCYTCGEEGHFARECSSSKGRGRWPPHWMSEDSKAGADYLTPPSRPVRRHGPPRWMDLHSRETRWTPPARVHALGTLTDPRRAGSKGRFGQRSILDYVRTKKVMF